MRAGSALTSSLKLNPALLHLRVMPLDVKTYSYREYAHHERCCVRRVRVDLGACHQHKVARIVDYAALRVLSAKFVEAAMRGMIRNPRSGSTGNVEPRSRAREAKVRRPPRAVEITPDENRSTGSPLLLEHARNDDVDVAIGTHMKRRVVDADDLLGTLGTHRGRARCEGKPDERLHLLDGAPTRWISLPLPS